MTDYQNRNLLYQLIICSLNETKIEGSLDGSLEDVMELSVRQNVVALALDGLQKWSIKTGGNVQTELKLKWLGYVTLATQRYAQTILVEKTISKCLYDKRIKALVLKGTAISQYYNTPELRQFSDIDIYAPSDYNAIDEILKALGSDYQFECYRHSQCVVHSVTVENHIYLTDARWRNKWSSLELHLRNMAEDELRKQCSFGLCNPSGLFSVIFFVYHALGHFIYDRLDVRFLVDWYFLLTKRNAEEDRLMVTNLVNFGLMPMAGALTALCVKRLGLDMEIVPEKIRNEVDTMQIDVLERFEDDMFDIGHGGFTSNSIRDRIRRIPIFFKYGWKIKQFFGISVYRFVFYKIIAILTWQIK